MPIPAADDFRAIRATMLRWRYEREGCAPRWGRPIETCWCRYIAWSCPPPTPPEPPAEAPQGAGDNLQDVIDAGTGR